MGRERIQKVAFRVVSQTGIHYRNSSLSRSTDNPPRGAPRAGDRFPWLRLRFSENGPVEDLFQKLDDTRFHLLVVGQPAPSEGSVGLGDLLSVLEIPADAVNEVELARAKILRPSFYLLRPDGHVGLCGKRLVVAAVARYVSGRLRIATATS
jgi:hypothetical protein